MSKTQYKIDLLFKNYTTSIRLVLGKNANFLEKAPKGPGVVNITMTSYYGLHPNKTMEYAYN